MLSDAIRRWNPWWAEGNVSSELIGVKREELEVIEKFIGTGLIKGIVGPRRAGKTTLLYQAINYLIQQGITPKNIVLLNFDDSNIYNTDFAQLISECRKINPKITHLFLDEVQEREGWERWVRTLYDTKQFAQIFVTGSSSSLLKEDVARVLTGRHTTFYVLPFSFREYLVFSDWHNFSKDYIESRKDEILYHLHRYLKIGGYPEALKMDDTTRNKYLNDLFDDILARDVVARHKADYHLTRRIAYYIISNASKIMTHRSIASACGVAVGTVSKYLNYLHDSCLIHFLRFFSFKLKEQMREINKYYAVDTGLANAVSFKFSENIGQIAENAVYIELLRRCKTNFGTELYYWKDKAGKEVDFIIKKGEKVEKLIQVCWDVSEEKTKKREILGLLRAMDEFGIREGIIITENYEDRDIIERKKIIYKPLWKWLLEK